MNRKVCRESRAAERRVRPVAHKIDYVTEAIGSLRFTVQSPSHTSSHRTHTHTTTHVSRWISHIILTSTHAIMLRGIYTAPARLQTYLRVDRHGPQLRGQLLVDLVV